MSILNNLNFKSLILKLFILLIFIVNISSKVIIWDLGNTLIKVSKMSFIKNVGLKDLLGYVFCDGKSPKRIKEQVFGILDNLSNEKCYREYRATDQDCFLPEIMCKWLEGKITGQEVYFQAVDFIEDNEDMFISDRHKRIIKKIIKGIFIPEVFSKSIKPIKSVIKLLNKCAKNNHELFILSNLDSDTLNCIKNSKKTNKIFKYFEANNIVISADVGLIKPDPSIYNYVINNYKLDPNDCIFIDDQIENVITAQNIGIKAILFKNSCQLKRELKRINII